MAPWLRGELPLQDIRCHQDNALTCGTLIQETAPDDTVIPEMGIEKPKYRGVRRRADNARSVSRLVRLSLAVGIEGYVQDGRFGRKG